MRRKRADTMNPMVDALFNERGEEGHADALFYIEDGVYKATLIAEKRWRTPSGKKRSRKFVTEYTGWTPRALAADLRKSGWEPPRRLAHLCESAPVSRPWVRAAGAKETR